MGSTEIEKVIAEKGLTAQRLTQEDVVAKIKEQHFWICPGTTTTVCVLVLMNGYTVVGESACVSPENFDEDRGRSIARANALEKIWGLEGYLLKEQLHQATTQEIQA